MKKLSNFKLWVILLSIASQYDSMNNKKKEKFEILTDISVPQTQNLLSPFNQFFKREGKI